LSGRPGEWCTEFGKLVKIQEAEHGLVIDYEVYARCPADKTLLHPAIARHTEVFGRPPRLVAGDAGFWSGPIVTPPSRWGSSGSASRPPGFLLPQRQRWFRRGLRWRTGCEGRISVLKRRDGLARCRDRGAAVGRLGDRRPQPSPAHPSRSSPFGH
jgi:IS5 family transposase